MKVLLILGNGFDLNMSFPTSYRDFYDYYLQTPTPDDEAVRKVRDHIKENNLGPKETNLPTFINWSDLETALGHYTLKCSTPQEFVAAYKDIKKHLSRYLSEVEHLPFESLSDITHKFVSDLSNVQSYLDTKYQNEALSFIKGCPNPDQIEVDIMTFNYTNFAEKIKSSFEKLYASMDTQVSLGAIYHVHGVLDEEGIMMGVNDPTQILNETFRSDLPIRAYMLKPFLNAETVTGFDEEGNQAIRQADLLILFGVSLGATDRIWWNTIGNQVFSERKRIIYCPYESIPFATDRADVLVRNEELIQKVIKSMDSFSRADELKNKIYPLRKNQMFNFSSYLDDQQLARNKNQVLDSLFHALKNGRKV